VVGQGKRRRTDHCGCDEGHTANKRKRNYDTHETYSLQFLSRSRLLFCGHATTSAFPPRYSRLRVSLTIAPLEQRGCGQQDHDFAELLDGAEHVPGLPADLLEAQSRHDDEPGGDQERGDQARANAET